MIYSPTQVLAIEGLKESPFCCTFGCCEIETVAKKVIHWLAEHGDSWSNPLPELDTFGTSQELLHGHWAGSEYIDCNFRKEFINQDTGAVNSDFISQCTKLDGRRLKQSVLHAIYPDLFPEK